MNRDEDLYICYCTTIINHMETQHILRIYLFIESAYSPFSLSISLALNFSMRTLCQDFIFPTVLLSHVELLFRYESLSFNTRMEGCPSGAGVEASPYSLEREEKNGFWGLLFSFLVACAKQVITRTRRYRCTL